jgi:hypothetical protein
MRENSYGLSRQGLADNLPGRSQGAINVVREGVHSYHVGGNVSMFSQMMLNYLNHKRSTLECLKCGTKF